MITWPPAMFNNPQVLLNSTFGMVEGQNENVQGTPIVPNRAISGPVMQGLRLPNFDILDAIGATRPPSS